MKKFLLLWVLTISFAFAGKDIDLTTQTVENTSVAAQPTNISFTVDFSFNGYTSALGGGIHPCTGNPVGLDCQIVKISPTDIRLQLYNAREVSANVCQLQIASLPSAFVTARFVHNISTSTNICTLTNINGTVVQTDTVSFSVISGSNTNGVSLIGGGASEHLKWSYFRIFLYAITSTKPPTTGEFTLGAPGACTTVGSNALVYWNFDDCNNNNSLADISGNGYNAIVSGGATTYTSSIGQTLVKANIFSTLAANAPSWLSDYPGYGISWDSNNNFPSNLDCTTSYTQEDFSDTVTCAWSITDGPNVPTVVSPSSLISLVTGLISTNLRTSLKDYTVSLAATGISGVNIATSTQHVGAVAMDINGIVQNEVEVTKISNTQIAFGKNPWTYADDRFIAMATLQNTSTDGGSINGYRTTGLSWKTSGSGTVSYPFSGTGVFTTCTTLNGGINATTLTIVVASVACLDLATLPGVPTAISIGDDAHSQEIVRICSVAGNTLTVCYDGRGISDGFSFSGGAVPAQAWGNGVRVGQYLIKGTSTLFGTDPVRPLAPAGLPGPTGPVIYNTGNVQLTASSFTITGIGTTWNLANGVVIGEMIRINATHGGGNAFKFWCKITAVAATSISCNRSAPSDVDTATNFTYAITSTRYFSLGACSTGTTCASSDPQFFRNLQNSIYCESEILCIAIGAHDVTVFNTLVFTGMPISYKDGLGAQSAFGPNFYGSGLAARNFFHASGLQFARVLANDMDGNWPNDPELCNGWCGGIPLLQGGGVIGAIAYKVTDAATTLDWANLRQFGTVASIGASGCNDWDTRDSGIQQGYVALFALFDSTFLSTWNSALTSLYLRDVATSQPITSSTGCKGADNSWGNSFDFVATSIKMKLTQGSANVEAFTPGTFTSDMCNVSVNGTATATNGSAALAGISGTFQAGGQIVVVGITGISTVFNLATSFTVNSGSSVTLGGLWAGNSGTVNWYITTNDLAGKNMITIAASTNDPLTQYQWVCKFVDTSNLTLHRPWFPVTNTGGTLSGFSNIGTLLTGYFQQPFMLGGYKESALRWGSLNADATIAANYTTLTGLAASWVQANGFDPESKGLNYARLCNLCEPFTNVSSANVEWKVNAAQTGFNNSFIRAARVLNAEVQNAVGIYFLNNIGIPARQYGDYVYGATWGQCSLTSGGGATYYCDSNYVRDENSNAALASFKYPGFFFGIGLSQQWPALRITGLAPPGASASGIHSTSKASFGAGSRH